MRKYFIPGLILICLFAFSIEGFGQNYSRGKKKKKKSKPKVEQRDEREDPEKSSSDFAERLYYGMNIGNLSFGGSSFYGGSVFNINVGPMAGYNITERLSGGLIVKLDYFYERILVPGGNLRFESLDVGPTAFVRFKAFRGIFLQGEFERGSFQRPDENEPITNGNRIPSETFFENYVYFGIGYYSGYPWGFFASIHYNVLDSFDAIRIPWDYRVGFSYNF